MQPTFRQVPPTLLLSIHAVLRPNYEALIAETYPLYVKLKKCFF